MKGGMLTFLKLNLSLYINYCMLYKPKVQTGAKSSYHPDTVTLATHLQPRMPLKNNSNTLTNTFSAACLLLELPKHCFNPIQFKPL